jgi:hypothetical protein
MTTRRPDVVIVTASGARLSGYVVNGRVAIFEDNVCIGYCGQDLGELESWGTVHASGLLRARLELERGTSD